MHEKGKQGRSYFPMLLINISSFLGLRLKVDEHSMQCTKNTAYLGNSFATAGKTLVPGIGQKGLFL